MWLDEAGEVVEMFRSSFPYSFLFFVPIFIILSPAPAAAAHEFAVYRMQQYDLQGIAYGCRNAQMNVEARPIDTSVVTRRCVIAKLSEVTLERYKDLITQGAGGLLVLLPPDLATLSEKESEHLMELESELLQEESQVPVYFAEATDTLLDIYSDVKMATNSDQASSAAEALLGSAYANGFQMVVAGSQSKALNDFQVVNLQGKLTGSGIEEQLPTVAIVAHYDAFGIAPSRSFGADSNGSGVVALLELARLFNKLYTNSRTHAKYNLIFLLSGAGKFNYQGTKRYIEDQLDSGESSLLADAAYVLCLDTIGQTSDLHLHVSKPPKEGSAGGEFARNLEEAVVALSEEVNFSLVHKKINLADDFLSWEHERFSIRRLPAFTLSHLDSHKRLVRNSILDTRSTVEPGVLARNTRLIAEALARHIYNVSSDSELEIFDSGLQVEEDLITAWIDYLSSAARSAQLLNKESPVISSLDQAMNRYLKDVRKTTFKADKRDPEFVFYDGTDYTMSAYNVKPAVFDLFLAVGIMAYLAIVYVVCLKFATLHGLLRKIIGPIKAKQN